MILNKIAIFSGWVVLGFFLGCSTTGQHRHSSSASVPDESRKDAVSAIQSVTGAVSGKPLTQEEMKNLANDVRKNKETRSAVEAITDSMNPSENVVKYCPVDGERYSSKFSVCPVHHVPLKEVQ